MAVLWFGDSGGVGTRMLLGGSTGQIFSQGALCDAKWSQSFEGSSSVLCSFWHFPKGKRKRTSSVLQKTCKSSHIQDWYDIKSTVLRLSAVS